MVNGQASLRHDLLQVTVGERVSQIPAHAEQDDHVFEVPPTEQCWPFSGHDTPYQITSATFATEPSLECFDQRGARKVPTETAGTVDAVRQEPRGPLSALPGLG